MQIYWCCCRDSLLSLCPYSASACSFAVFNMLHFVKFCFHVSEILHLHCICRGMRIINAEFSAPPPNLFSFPFFHILCSNSALAHRGVVIMAAHHHFFLVHGYNITLYKLCPSTSNSVSPFTSYTEKSMHGGA